MAMGKNAFLPPFTILFILVLILGGMSVEVANAQTSVGIDAGDLLAASHHTIVVENPNNHTTYGSSLTLNVTVDFLETDGAIFWQTLISLNYSVDNKPPEILINNKGLALLSPPVNSNNATILYLTNGQHKIEITAVFMGDVGNDFTPTYTFTSAPVYFLVNTQPTNQTSPSPSPTSTAETTMSASLSESASALNFGNTINFTVSVNGGKAPYTYIWNIEQSSDVVLVETTTSPYYSSNTFGPGSHHVYVEVKDVDNNTAQTLTVEFNVLPLSSSPTFPSPSPTPAATPTESLTQEPTATPNIVSVWGNNIMWYFIGGAIIAVIFLLILFLLKKRD